MTLPFVVKKLLAHTGLARYVPAAKRLTDGEVDCLPYLSDRLLAAPVDELLDPATFPESTGPEVMNLNLAAPRYDSPVGGWRFSADRTGTPPANGLPGLREVFAERSHVEPEQVFVTHGATAAYAATLDAFVNAGEGVALFDPCSPIFRLGAKSRRARVRLVPTWNEDGRTRFLFEGLSRAMAGAKLFALADPCNPTGGTLHAEDIEQIAWLADRHDVLVYLDESFARFRYDAPAASLVTLPQMAKRLIVANSMTQGYGLGSLRVGWLTGPRGLVRACGLAANLCAPFVPTACQQAAVRAMQAEEGLFAPTLDAFRSKRRYTVDRLRGMGLQPTWPGGGFTTWVPVSPLGLDGRTFAERLLREFQVLVGPGIAYGPSGSGCVRVSYAVEDGRLREGLTRLSRFVDQLRGKPTVEEMRVSVSQAEPADDDAKVELHPSFSRV